MNKQEYQKRLERLLLDYKQGSFKLPQDEQGFAEYTAKAICLLNEEAIGAVKSGHDPDGYQPELDDAFNDGYNEVRQELKQIIGVSNE